MHTRSQQEAIAEATSNSWILWEQPGTHVVRVYVAQVIEQRGKKTIGPVVYHGRHPQQERRSILPTLTHMVRWLNTCAADFRKAKACFQTWEDERANATVRRMW